MECPACEGEMRHRCRDGIEIDVCATCRGVWLDASELDGLLGMDDDRSVEAGLDVVAKAPEECRYCGAGLEGQKRCSECDQRAVLTCPRDGGSMHVVDAIGVELDRCTDCLGLWVDGFERTRLSRMREALAGEAVAAAGGSSDDADSVVVMGAMMAGGVAGGDALSDAFGIGDGEADVEQKTAVTSTQDGADPPAAAEKTAQQPACGGRTMREYIEKYGEFRLTCSECDEELTKHTAWEREGEYFCMSCGDATLDDSLHRAMKYKEGDNAAYWHDEGHLVEVLQWIVGGIFSSKK